MGKYKILTEEDLKILEFSPEELSELDRKLSDLIKRSKNDEKAPCCSNCNCSGYRQGNPSTVCASCGHSWNTHRC